jgi:hypothetical protein
MKKKDPNDSVHQLGNLLLKYKGLLKPPQASVEKECIVIIKSLTGMELNPQQVSYTVATRTLVLKTPSLIRSELMMQRQAILKELQRQLGEKNAPLTII